MPIYDYKCDTCKSRFEVTHSMSAAPVQACPQCGAQTVRKILSTGGISVRSSGQASAPPPPCASGGGCSAGMCGLG